MEIKLENYLRFDINTIIDVYGDIIPVIQKISKKYNISNTESAMIILTSMGVAAAASGESYENLQTFILSLIEGYDMGLGVRKKIDNGENYEN